jgi:hypothetical protein
LKEVSDGSVSCVETNNKINLAASPETIRVTLNRNEHIEQSVKKSTVKNSPFSNFSKIFCKLISLGIAHTLYKWQRCKQYIFGFSADCGGGAIVKLGVCSIGKVFLEEKVK